MVGCRAFVSGEAGRAAGQRLRQLRLTRQMSLFCEDWAIPVGFMDSQHQVDVPVSSVHFWYLIV